MRSIGGPYRLRDNRSEFKSVQNHYQRVYRRFNGPTTSIFKSILNSIHRHPSIYVTWGQQLNNSHVFKRLKERLEIFGVLFLIVAAKAIYSFKLCGFHL